MRVTRKAASTGSAENAGAGVTTMDAELIAALERTLRTLNAITVDDESRADARLIRALIERERAGGERAAVVRYQRIHDIKKAWRDLSPDLYRTGDCILVWVNEGDILLHGKRYESGAHMAGEGKEG